MMIGNPFKEYERVYICSPYRGIVQRNVARARLYCAFAVAQDCMPIAPHLLYPQFMDDNNGSQRETAMVFALDLMKRCEELWIFDENGISEGMRKEIEQATDAKHAIQVRFMQHEFDEWFTARGGDEALILPTLEGSYA